MAVSNTTLRSPATGGYACNGSVTDFAGGFRLLAEGDVDVILRDSEGNESTLTLTTEYTVAPTGGSYPCDAFTVTTVSTYASGNTITLIRNQAVTQTQNISNSGTFYPNNVEDGLDRNTLAIQQLQEEVDRSVKVPVGSTLDPDTLWSDFEDGTLTAVAYTSEKLLTNYSSLSAAITTLGATECTLVIDKDDTMTGNVTVPSNIALRFVNGKKITTDTNTLTINGRIIATSAQIFVGTGGTIDGTPIVEHTNVKWFGATGDGTTDDSDAIQDAIDFMSNGGTVLFPSGDYRVTKTSGTNDKWGLKVPYSNIVLRGDGDASIRRQSTDISTYAKSFPLILVGVSDDNSSAISNITITDLEFVGEDARHAISGAAIMDGRQAIWLKNADGVVISGCRFTSIDSSSVFMQHPGMYDYENSAYYNTTKCYNVKIVSNEFIADSHSTNGRALLHTITGNADNVVVSNNNFEWCDDCVSCSTTYDDYDDKETDTYTNSNLGTAVKRTGRGYVISNNTMYNSSEHAIYAEAMNMSITGNTITVDNSTVCNTAQVQVRGRMASISGNTLTGVFAGINITTGAMDISVSGNSMHCVGDTSGGVFSLQSQGLTAYIDGRSDYFGSYKPMRNITISGNTVDMPDASQTNGVCMRIYSDDSDANYPDGQMQNITISGNVFNRPRYAILVIGIGTRRVTFTGNVFNGKDFVEAGFTTGTTQNSLAVLAVDDSNPTGLYEVAFDNNKVYGFEYILYDDGASGTNMRAPWGFRGNRMDYIKYWDTARFIGPGYESAFYNNIGQYFIGRGWATSTAINNGLFDGTTATSVRRSQIELVGAADVRIYYDDAGNFKAL